MEKRATDLQKALVWAPFFLTESFTGRLPGIFTTHATDYVKKSIVQFEPSSFSFFLLLKMLSSTLFLCTALKSSESPTKSQRQHPMSLSRCILGLACLWHGVIASPLGAVPSNIPIATDLQTAAETVAQPIANSAAPRKLHGKFLHITGGQRRDDRKVPNY